MTNRSQQANGRHLTDGATPVGLILVLEPGERLSGMVGRVDESDRRHFCGWIDLMGAIDWLRAGNGKDHGAP
jgi:hypothetical protein